MAAEHKHPNYMSIFWLLAILTVVEIGVVFLPFGKMVNGTLLTGLAVGKAALVAMYFMHLKFETRTLGLIAVTPLAIATLLVFVILPDAFRVAHKTANVKPAAEAPAKH
jgi:cytochrome c oxidase subunit 4